MASSISYDQITTNMGPIVIMCAPNFLTILYAQTSAPLYTLALQFTGPLIRFINIP